MSGGILRGGCHCGALGIELSTDLPVQDIPVRACQCGFCRIHAALSASDPRGSVLFEVRDPQALVRYRFGLKLADFLLCARCGAYVGAFMPEASATRGLAVVNINALEDARRFPAPQTMSYDGETPEQRLQRRRQRWMPASLRVTTAVR